MQIVLSDGVFIAILVAGVVGLAIWKQVPTKIWKTIGGFGIEVAPNKKKAVSRQRQKVDDQP